MTGSLAQVLVGVAIGAMLALWMVGGLAWTIRRLPDARRPGLLMVVSLAVRLGLGLAIVLALALLGAIALVSGAVTYLVGRTLLVRIGRAWWSSVVED